MAKGITKRRMAFKKQRQTPRQTPRQRRVDTDSSAKGSDVSKDQKTNKKTVKIAKKGRPAKKVNNNGENK